MNSRELAYILRHHPEEYGLKLDGEGWCSTEELLKALDIEMEELDDIVLNNTRFIYSSEKEFIKAAHGHSTEVDYNALRNVPPKYLYHGTTMKAYMSICRSGICRMSRAMVHLSDNKEDALRIAKRHGEDPVVLVVDAESMKDKHIFYKSEDGVWLVRHVPFEYIIDLL